MKNISLEQIQIPEPCTASWDAMEGTEERRFCGKCNKHVHDVSAMRRSEGMKLMAGEHVCIRMRKDASGRVLTREDRRMPGILRRMGSRGARWLPGFLLAGVTMFWSACTRTTVLGGAPLPPPSRPAEPGVTTLMELGEAKALPPVMGTTQPATCPATQPAVHEIMGDVAFPTTAPATQPAPEPQMGKVSL